MGLARIYLHVFKWILNVNISSIYFLNTSFAFPGSVLCVSCGFKMFTGFKISVKQWKKDFFKLNFLKCKAGDPPFYIQPMTHLSDIIQWSLEITFLCQWWFFISWQTNKVILPASQKVILVSTTLYVILYCTILFHLLLYRNENWMHENGNTIKEKGSCHNLDTLKQWSGCY